MHRSFCALVALLLGAGFLVAEEYKGKVKSVEKTKITLTVDGKEMTFPIGTDPLVINDKAKNVKGGVTAVTVGSEVVIFTAKKDGKEEVTTINVGAAKKK